MDISRKQVIGMLLSLVIVAIIIFGKFILGNTIFTFIKELVN